MSSSRANSLRRVPRLALGLLATGALAGFAAAQRSVRINLGTLAPKGSSYDQCLREMGEAWREASNGKVKVNVYPGGALGGEAEMVSMIRLGTIQAGLVTGVGLSDVEPGISGMQSMPMMFRDLDEVDYINARLAPVMEERLAAKGFVVLFWTDVGWVRLFTSKPTLEPSDLMQRRLFAWQGNPDQVEILADAGYNPISLETGEIVTSLRTGMINAVHVPPMFALAGQLDTSAGHMLELNWAPLIGALVVQRATWEKIPAELRVSLQAAADKAGRTLRARGREESDRAVSTMQARGLVVHAVPPDLAARWHAEVEAVYPQIRGRIVPADVFDLVQGLLRERRGEAQDGERTCAPEIAAQQGDGR